MFTSDCSQRFGLELTALGIPRAADITSDLVGTKPASQVVNQDGIHTSHKAIIIEHNFTYKVYNPQRLGSSITLEPKAHYALAPTNI